jgi:hypothetical protein
MPAAKHFLLPRFGCEAGQCFLHGVQTARLTLAQAPDRNDDLLVRRRFGQTAASRESLATMSRFPADFEIAMFLKKSTQTPRLTHRLPRRTNFVAAPIEQTPVPVCATLRTSAIAQWYHLLATQIFYQPSSRHNLRDVAALCW